MTNSNPRLKLAANVVSIGGGIFLRSDLATLRLQGEDVATFTETLVPLLDGTRCSEEIAKQLPEHEPESVLGFLADMERQGFVERVSDEESGCRAQERFLAAWRGYGQDHMRALHEAFVAIVGLEPWGVAVAGELAASGVARLHLCDERLVQGDDLLATRVFTPAMSDKPRAEALADALSATAPATELSSGSLDELQLSGNGACDLVVGAFSPDELARGLALARTCHRAGVRSISGCLRGTEAIIGPLVFPGQSPCWNCLRLRQLANAPRPEDERLFQDAVLETALPPRPRAYLATMPPLVGQLMALEAVKFLVGESSPLVGRVLIHDLMSGEAALHTLVRVPWCEVCGNTPGRARSPVSAFPGAGERPPPNRLATKLEGKQRKLDEVETPGELRDFLASWVDSRVGIVNSVIVQRPKPDEPQLPFFSSAVLSAFGHTRASRWQPKGGAGKGLTRIAAAMSAVGEALERYSACVWRAEAVHRAPLGDLEGDVLDPRSMCFFTEEQYADPDFPYARFNPEQAIDWIQGRWLDGGSPVWVPALAAYFYYPVPREETVYPASGNGLAAGANAGDAALRATLELLERDSFILGWLSRSSPRPLAVKGGLDEGTREVLRQLECYAGRIELYLLDAGVPIPVVACLSLGDGQRWPGAALGLGTDLSPTVAARKAILEQAQVGLYLRRVMRTGELDIPKSREEVRSELDHMTYYIPAERAEALNFWRESGREPVELRSLVAAETNSLSSLNTLLRRSGLRVAIVDVTAPDVAESPFRVMRALGAGIQQISFGYREQQLCNPRLLALASEELNPYPHPLG